MPRGVQKEIVDETDKARMTKEEREKRKEGKKKQKEKKKELRKPVAEKEIEIARIIEQKQDKKENLIEIRTVEEMVLRWFHKCLKIFEKKSERIPIRKIWDHAIDFREGFVVKKGKIYLLSRIKREEVQNQNHHKCHQCSLC